MLIPYIPYDNFNITQDIARLGQEKNWLSAEDKEKCIWSYLLTWLSAFSWLLQMVLITSQVKCDKQWYLTRSAPWM